MRRRTGEQAAPPRLQLAHAAFARIGFFQTDQHQIVAVPARDAHLVQRRQHIGGAVGLNQCRDGHPLAAPGIVAFENAQFAAARRHRVHLVALEPPPLAAQRTDFSQHGVSHRKTESPG